VKQDDFQLRGRKLDRFTRCHSPPAHTVLSGCGRLRQQPIKRTKRIGLGFRNFENYRIRAQLCAGKPNWRVLDSIVVR
jgi:hypothetical protein